MNLNLLRTIFIASVTLLGISTIANAQNVIIPNANFKAALVGNLSINTNSDSEIQLAEASAFTGSINISNSGISNLTGIEAFTSLTGLNCNFNSLTALNLTNNTVLNYLDCSSNQLAGLNISANTALTVLNISGNQLTSLDVTANTALTKLNCAYNQFTSLYLYTITSLKHLECNDNQLTNLDVTTNTVLNYLQCQSNQLTDLIVPASLDTMFCGYNQLTVLDVAACTSLHFLMCNNNQLASLDLSTSTLLSVLNCSGNIISYLDIKNGNNTNIIDFDATNNVVNYCCVQVDDTVYAKANINWSIDPFTMHYNTYCYAPCIVYIPDWQFKNDLLLTNTINTNGDGEIQCSEAAAFNGLMNVTGHNITDLTGIEAFTSLPQLNCFNNNLTTLDLSSNTALYSLTCSNNNITSLTINPALEYLNCSQNQLSTLNLSGAPNLYIVNCVQNQLTTLDISNHLYLFTLDCSINLLTSLNVSGCTGLSQLECSSNALTNLNVSTNTSLIKCYCNFNQLVYLNMKNGHNTFMSNFNFYVFSNPNLTCIQVDNAAWSTSNWFAKDATAFFNENCSVGIENHNSINEIRIYPNPSNGIFTIKNSEKSDLTLEVYNVLGEKIYSTSNNKEELNTIDMSNASKGIYFIKIYDIMKSYSKMIEIN